jgi:glycerol-3-phosphate dehydrogenase (NAD(P)+)
VLVRDSGVEMPICQALHAVLYEGLPVRQAVDALMSRAAKPEF